MWRRAASHLHALASRRFTLPLSRPAAASAGIHPLRNDAVAAIQRTTPFSVVAGNPLPPSNRRVEEFMPIATGFEREELEAELEGRNRFDMDPPVGPFGTKEAPAVITSYYDERIVGCPGGEGDDEHDVVWFWLKKGKPHECHVCSQHFVLEVGGPGGPPDGHGDGEHH